MNYFHTALTIALIAYIGIGYTLADEPEVVERQCPPPTNHFMFRDTEFTGEVISIWEYQRLVRLAQYHREISEYMGD